MISILFLNKFKGDLKDMLIDLHGFCLKDAIEEVLCKLNELVANGQQLLEIIHGYRNGQVLKNYFQSKEFLKDMKACGYIVTPKHKGKNPGMSRFNVKPNS